MFFSCRRPADKGAEDDDGDADPKFVSQLGADEE